MRSGIALLLGLGLLAGGCDRQDGEAEQAAANAESVATNSSTASPAGSKVVRTSAGEAAPDFPLTAPDGTTTTLAAYRGTPVLVNLWATWCAPCVKEMPTLEALAKREGDAVKVVTISQDLDGPTKVVPYFEKAGFTAIEPWTDPDLRFSVGLNANLPTTILYDAQGREVWRMAGAMDWAGEDAAKLIAEARS